MVLGFPDLDGAAVSGFRDKPGPANSPKWGNQIRSRDLQNSPRCQQRVLNFTDEVELPATRTLSLGLHTPWQPDDPPIGLDIHPVALISGGTGAGAFTFELDWVHGTQFCFTVTSVTVVLTFDLPADAQAVVPNDLEFFCFVSPGGSPSGVFPVRSLRFADIPAGVGQSDSVRIPPLARRWRAYTPLADGLADAELQIWRTNAPSVIAAQDATLERAQDIFGPAQLAALVNDSAENPIANAWAVFEVAA